ncbi:UPF0310 protein YdcG [Paenibacillus baekrokdamisoli]|uniref:UPF0310 protein Back11_48120 n=1 Tax=Paenibacillus baekrokdamisoli TaxID=1712516 RepID=A0A3G9IX27_9BACL|nr:EVE domain-containing protein [Paenibacillus baekrokdamisoli]MBB3068634.1 hypothetical protein [Paenibacillus baekrokdamisoli]BBH23467.1 UPF0310 protein YdcG [Paenibacillus baekrokdamisoli]
MAEELIHEQRRYWVGVVSASHVRMGVQGGFAQLCHGKSAPLRRMHPGDWLIYYSPRIDMAKGEPLQAFTAIGQVADDRVYEYQMSDTFVPYRRNIRYSNCEEVKIIDLLNQLSFTRGNRNWGYQFRFGHFEIGCEDFLTIAKAMLGDVQGMPINDMKASGKEQNDKPE